MNREEAIYFANCLKNNYTIDLNDMQAFCDEAIKALEQEPITKNDSSELEKNSKKLEKDFGELDCIDRAELLKAMDTWDKFGFERTGCFVREPKDDYVTYVHYDDMVKCVKGMPSVTPKLSVPEVTALAEWTEKLTKECEEAYNKGYADGMKEQESILDKLRAEIEKLKPNNPNFKGYFEQNVALNKVLEILDMYKAERSDKE
jgi:hypothetical protein